VRPVPARARFIGVVGDWVGAGRLTLHAATVEGVVAATLDSTWRAARAMRGGGCRFSEGERPPALGRWLGGPLEGDDVTPRRQTDCQQCLVRDRAICGDIPTDQRQAFLAIRHCHRYRPRQVIFHEETPALGFYVLCSGRVKLTRSDRQGRQQIIRLARPGDIMGEEALLPKGDFRVTAEALEESQAAFIRREDLLGFLDKGNGMSGRFLLHLCQLLIQAQDRLARMALGDARERLAGVLLDLARDYGRRTLRGTDLDLSMSRAELAALAGLSPETGMRLLSQFKAEGLVEVNGRHLTLLRPDALAAIGA
jgi:CRP/FNR family transcriptional regulator